MRWRNIAFMNDTLIIEAKTSTPQRVIVWLHGLGASGNDLAPLCRYFASDIRHVLPNAPIRPVTLNNGYAMPAWYDIRGTELLDREDEIGITASTEQVHGWVEQQIRQGIASKNIILAGFSQGGALALHAGLQYKNQLGGIVALSCYLPLAKALATAPTQQLDTPVFIAAGQADPIVNINWSKAAYDQLEKAGCRHLTWKTNPMEHAICPDEIRDIVGWVDA